MTTILFNTEGEISGWRNSEGMKRVRERVWRNSEGFWKSQRKSDIWRQDIIDIDNRGRLERKR